MKVFPAAMVSLFCKNLITFQSWLIWATFCFCFTKSSFGKLGCEECSYQSFEKCRSSRSQMFFRSSRPKDFCKKAALRDFAKFTGKHLCQSLLIHKVAGQGRQHYLKRDPGTDVSYEFCEIWKNTFFTEHLSWLLLVLQNRCCYKFSNIHQKISVLKSFLDS